MSDLAIIPIEEQQLDIVQYDGFVDTILQRLKDSKALPAGISNAEQARMVIVTGRSLKIDWATALNQIYIVNGRTCLSANLMKALLDTNGIKVKVLEDFVPYYKEKMFTNIETKAKEGRKVEYNRTTLLFTKVTKYIGRDENNKRIVIKDVEELGTVSATWEDIITSGLSDKDTYKKYPKEMLYNFAFRFGARRYAASCLMGMYEVNELLDSSDNKNATYNVEEDRIDYA